MVLMSTKLQNIGYNFIYSSDVKQLFKTLVGDTREAMTIKYCYAYTISHD
ncbi:hypothetical protein BTN50_1239 [Candidatus Enterovibrio altilux]|uniref:Mobile element protein n=1 Tax=Candidatus Enterovibrio altilux TaxID=1927128 RepID=A0A291B9S3_9GAMM|nr:hypothetical protein BTN50_1239 [Candidatus Enterovibrio luxaltus]